ncbi:MAG TPA: LuxR C-terminal-related transcriptional regulator [Gaiellaceae bacterium]|jgi:DNA-binding NarL/FixJ family response regulator
MTRNWGVPDLSDSEFRVLRQLTTGMSLTEISRRLDVSHDTVREAAISIYTKLGLLQKSDEPSPEQAS